MSKKFIKDLVVGESLNEVFILKSISTDRNNDYSIVLADKTGEINGYIPKACYSASIDTLVGNPVMFNGIVSNMGKSPYLKCRSISVATSFKMSDLMYGLPEEKKEAYKVIIRTIQAYVKNPHYKALVDSCLTDEVLDKLGILPATLSSYGKYPGGALASCAVVSDMAVHMGKIYLNLGNGIYTKDFQWSLLLTAALLHTYGNIRFITNEVPFKKTDIGNCMGLLAILQQSLQELCVKEQIPLTDEEFADLINTLHASIYASSPIKAVNKEGVMLRHIISLFNECDVFDCEVANTDFGEGKSAWSGKLKRMIQPSPLSDNMEEETNRG